MRRLSPLVLLLIVCLTHAHAPASVCSVVASEVQERKLNDASICAGIAARPEGLRAEACHDFVSGYKTRLDLVAKGDVSAAFLCDNLDLSPPHRHEGCTLWESLACITPIHAATTECSRRYSSDRTVCVLHALSPAPPCGECYCEQHGCPAPCACNT